MKYELERNGKIVEVSANEMVEFWQGFVEGQSKSIHYYSKKVREQRNKIKELEQTLEKSILLQGDVEDADKDFWRMHGMFVETQDKLDKAIRTLKFCNKNDIDNLFDYVDAVRDETAQTLKELGVYDEAE